MIAAMVVPFGRRSIPRTLFENGNVLLPRQKHWVQDYINEITGFPGTKFDDQVDSTTQALDYIKNNDMLDMWRRLAG
jgi:phage terminase large subunit-like protein